MNLGLDGRVAIVTGAGAGIGRATVAGLVAEGCRVLAVDRNADRLAAAVADFGDAVATLAADVTDATAPGGAVALAGSRFGGLDVLVNNAGVAATRAGFLQTSDEDWQRGFAVNFFAAAAFCRAALPALTERQGVIVNVASTSGRYPEPFLVDYAAAKAALLSLTGSLATEFGPRGVRVLAVAPGPTRTEMWDSPGGFIDAIAEKYGMDREQAVDHHIRDVRGIALGRPGDADQVAAAIVFAASAAAGHLTGTTVAVHGGMATHLM